MLIIVFHNSAKAPKNTWGSLRASPMYVVHPMECKLEDVMGLGGTVKRYTLCNWEDRGKGNTHARFRCRFTGI